MNIWKINPGFSKPYFLINVGASNSMRSGYLSSFLGSLALSALLSSSILVRDLAKFSLYFRIYS